MLDLQKIKKLLRVAKPNMWLFFGSIAFIGIASFFEVFGISLVIPIINSFAAGGNFINNLKMPYLGEILKLAPFHSNIGIFTLLIIIIFFSILFSNLFLFGSAFYMSRFSTNIQHYLRTGILSRLLYFGKAYYDKTQFGSIMSIVLRHTNVLGDLLSSFRSLLVNLIMAIAFLLFLFFVSWQLTLFILPLIPIIYYSLNWLVKKLRFSSKEQSAAWIDLYSYTADLLLNVILIKSYAKEDSEYDKFANKSDKLRFHSFNVSKKDSAVSIMTDMIASAGFLAFVFLSVVFYMRAGTFPLGKFLVFFYVLRRFVTCLKPITSFKSNIAQLSPIIENLVSFFEDSDKALMNDGAKKMGPLSEKVEFRNVSFRYIKESEILKNVSFTVKKGQKVAIVGPTGGGKTTIAHLLCRFYDCDSGAITIDDVNIRDFTLESLRKNIALVSQDVMLFNDTIKNNITYGMDKQVLQQELDEIAKKAQLYEFIMSLLDKYDTYVGDRGVRLSGGEKQRVSIARAILKNADILILDEATSSLDSETELLIQKALEELVQTKTVIAIAHRLSTIKNADWIIVLEDGQITEQGTLEELLRKRGRFFYYWDLQKFY